MFLDDAVRATARFEGRIQWMYVNKQKGVSVGVGQTIPDAEAALRYRFRRPNAEVAERAEVIAEFESVMRMMPGYGPKAYRRSGSLLLPDEEIDRVLRMSMSSFVAGLALLFRSFHEFPDAAKIALLDLRFTLGISGMKPDRMKLFDSVNAQRWDAASLQCQRAEVPEERNEWTKEQFLMASSDALRAKEQTS